MAEVSGRNCGTPGRGKLFETDSCSKIYDAYDDFHFADPELPKEMKISERSKRGMVC